MDEHRTFVERLARSARGSGHDGFALPGVMFLLLGMMAILSVGAVAAINTQRGAARDSSSKSALAVAETGVDTALLRYARAERAGTISTASPCVLEDGTTGAPGSDGWCSEISGATGDDGYSYYVKPEVVETEGEDAEETALDVAVEVVSVGTAGDVSRVVEVYADSVVAVDPTPIYLTETIVTDQHLNLDSGVDIFGSIGSNGTIEIGGGGTVCGDIRYGEDASSDPSALEGAQDKCKEDIEVDAPYPESFDLTRASLPEEMTDADWDANNALLGELGGATWSASERTLTVDDGGGSTVTIDDPGPYLICRLEILGQATMQIAPGVEAHFYFDDPAECELDEHQRDIEVNGEVVPGAYEQMLLDRGNMTTSGDSEPVPIFYFLGSDTAETVIEVNTNSGQSGEFRGVIYAPDSHILNSRGGLRLYGAIVGRSASIKSGGDVEEQSSVIEGGDFQVGVNDSIYTVFAKENFRECPVAAAEAATPYTAC